MSANIQSSYTATVSSSEARFVFPLPERSEWEWNQLVTPDNVLEYRWTVEVETKKKLYEIGFLLFKYPGDKPSHGNIKALLQAGQRSVAVESEGGRNLMPDAPVEVTAADGQLIITVNSPEVLRMIFSGQPKQVAFNVLLPGQESLTHAASIIYSS